MLFCYFYCYWLFQKQIESRYVWYLSRIRPFICQQDMNYKNTDLVSLKAKHNARTMINDSKNTCKTWALFFVIWIIPVKESVQNVLSKLPNRNVAANEVTLRLIEVVHVGLYNEREWRENFSKLLLETVVDLFVDAVINQKYGGAKKHSIIGVPLSLVQLMMV